ncbi:MAG: hypothetical protein Q9219_004928, partial [cf. Caloplaca sp. 3 TL-2023]
LMRRNGNVTSNRIYNPRNLKPAIPLDVDEVDAALERFLRQKYDQQSFSGGNAVRPAARQDTGSTRSSDDQPPPLPPKPGKRFGFGLRSASSVLPRSKHTHISPPTSPDTANGYPPSPPLRVNKESRVFGASVGGGGDSMESKLATLRDMGFADEKRNLTILKGLNGNLERAIETLVRLGDGNTPTSRPRSPARSKPAAVSQPFSSVGVEPPGAVNGITRVPATSQESKIEENAPPQIPSNKVNNESIFSEPQSYNPFDSSNTRPDPWPLDKAFENMQVSQSQPLFPNATGGYPIQPDHIGATRSQHSMTPPVPQLHQHIHANPYVQQIPTTNNSFNPFFQPAQQAPPMPPNFLTSDTHPQQNNNMYFNTFTNSIDQPYTNSNTYQSSPNFASSQMPQQQSTYMTNQSQAQSVFQQQAPNPYPLYQPPNVQTPFSHQPIQYQPQPLQPQPTGRFDKSSILALYNYPHMALPPPLPSSGATPENQAPPTEPLTSPGGAPKVLGQRSVTMPTQLMSGSRNPFLTTQTNNNTAMSSNTVPAMPSSMSRHVSQESVDIGSHHSGRHSPDAFSSLSARFVR